jgi:hypothetical protein
VFDVDLSIRRYRDCVKTQRSDFSLKGCQIVAGGRSVAQTTGKKCLRGQYPGESVGITFDSLCDLCELCVSVVDSPTKTFTTEAQRPLRKHRERDFIYFSDRLRRGATVFLTPVPGVDLFSIVVRWSALRCDHRLLSDSPLG